jgi:hypothetical protein
LHVATIFLKESACTYFDYEEVIAGAERKFKEICGEDAEFLPAAPEPEDIVLEGENTD